jgi:hypothetical protein
MNFNYFEQPGMQRWKATPIVAIRILQRWKQFQGSSFSRNTKEPA